VVDDILPISGETHLKSSFMDSKAFNAVAGRQGRHDGLNRNFARSLRFM